MRSDEIIEHLITNILGGYDETILAPPRDVGFLHVITDEVNFILGILATWHTPRDLDMVWFGEDEQKALKQEDNDKISKLGIFETASKIWDNMDRAFASTNTMHPAGYILPPVRVTPYRTREERDRDLVLGWHHLGVVYPVSKAETFLKEEKRKAREEKRRRKMEEKWMERMEEQMRQKKLKQIQGVPNQRPGRSTSYRPYHPNRSNCSGSSDRPSLPVIFTQPVYPQSIDLSDDISNEGSCQIAFTIHFPQMREIIGELLNNLVTRSYNNIAHIPYKETISYHGVERITEDLYDCINQDVRILEGKTVEADLLRTVISSQRSELVTWPQNSGYVDIVFDDRNTKYWRSYVGQTTDPGKRLNSHFRGATKEVPESLHYYVIQKGHGHRSMNFFRLWTIDTTNDLFEDEGTMFIMANILEMSFTRAFESLPVSVLGLYFDQPADHPFSGLGLNILPPLMQGVTAKLHTRQSFSFQVEMSIDPDISSWPVFRATTRIRDDTVSGWNKDLLSSKWQDYIERLETAISETGLKLQIPLSIHRDPEEVPFSFETWKAQLIKEIHEESMGSNIICPFGNYKASIGILVHQALFHIQDDDKDEKAIPWGIRESGFDEANSLIWFLDPRLGNMRKRTENKKSTQAVLKKHTKLLIEQSNLSVILLDESMDLYLDLEADPSIHQVKLSMYCGNLTFFIQEKDHKLQRIYIQSPVSFTRLFASPGPKISQICEMFKYAAVLTETKGINPYFSNSRAAFHLILRTRCEEKLGASKMTIETIHPIIQSWAYRKGFQTTEDLQLLQDYGGGSLTTGLAILLHVLSRNNNTREFKLNRQKWVRQEKGIIPSKRKKWLDPAAVENVERLVKRLKSDVATPTNAEADDGISDAPNGDSLGVMLDEALGPVSSRRMEDILTVANEKHEAFLAESAPGEIEWLDFDAKNASLDVQGSEDVDIEETLTTTPLNNGSFQTSGTVSAPLRYLRRMTGFSATTMEQLLGDGRLYTGYWDERKGIYLIRCGPAIARIELLMSILRPDDVPDQVLVKAHIDPGEAHPNKWATSSIPGKDPAAKLAFSVTMNGNVSWISSNTEGATRKANTFVDIAMDVSLEEIVKRPRRHFNIQAQQVLQAHGVLEVGSYFTEDNGKLVRRVWKKRGVEKA